VFATPSRDHAGHACDFRLFGCDPSGFFTVVNPAGGAGVLAAVRELIVPVSLEVVA